VSRRLSIFLRDVNQKVSQQLEAAAWAVALRERGYYLLLDLAIDSVQPQRRRYRFRATRRLQSTRFLRP
jgi:hypothetical protein